MWHLSKSENWRQPWQQQKHLLQNKLKYEVVMILVEQKQKQKQNFDCKICV